MRKALLALALTVAGCIGFHFAYLAYVEAQYVTVAETQAYIEELQLRLRDRTGPPPSNDPGSAARFERARRAGYILRLVDEEPIPEAVEKARWILEDLEEGDSTEALRTVANYAPFVEAVEKWRSKSPLLVEGVDSVESAAHSAHRLSTHIRYQSLAAGDGGEPDARSKGALECLSIAGDLLAQRDPISWLYGGLVLGFSQSLLRESAPGPTMRRLLSKELDRCARVAPAPKDVIHMGVAGTYDLVHRLAGEPDPFTPGHPTVLFRCMKECETWMERALDAADLTAEAETRAAVARLEDEIEGYSDEAKPMLPPLVSSLEQEQELRATLQIIRSLIAGD